MSGKKLTPVQQLIAAMDRCAVARGEAQWTNGYRVGVAKSRPDEEARLHPKEMAQWSKVNGEEEAFRRLARRVLREARRGAR